MIKRGRGIPGQTTDKEETMDQREIMGLVDQREEINKKILATRSERVKRQLVVKYAEKGEVKRSIKADEKKWMKNIASEADDAATKQHIKTLYGLTKTLCNEIPRQSTAVLDKNENLVSGKDEVRSRWTEHFKGVLNRKRNQKTQSLKIRNLYVNSMTYTRRNQSIDKKTTEWEGTGTHSHHS